MATLELPEDLTEDMEVLFVNPYSPQTSQEMQLTGASTGALKSAYHEAQERDPGFRKFEDKVGLIKTMLGLGGYCLGDDLIILYGDREALEKAENSLKDQYTCFFDTMGDFLAHCDVDDNVVVIEAEKPVIH